MHVAGVLLLNFEARDYHNVVYRLVEEFGVNDDLSSETKAEVLRTQWLCTMHHATLGVNDDDSAVANFNMCSFRLFYVCLVRCSYVVIDVSLFALYARYLKSCA